MVWVPEKYTQNHRQKELIIISKLRLIWYKALGVWTPNENKNQHYIKHNHLAYVPGDLAKATIVHIAPSEPMTTLVHRGTSLGYAGPPLS